MSRIAKIPKEQGEKITKIFKLARNTHSNRQREREETVESKRGEVGEKGSDIIWKWGRCGGAGIKFSYEKLAATTRSARKQEGASGRGSERE